MLNTYIVRCWLISAFVFTLFTNGLSQSQLNPGFEIINNSIKHPVGWSYPTSERIADYSAALDSVIKYKGSYSCRIKANATDGKATVATISYSLPAIYAGSSIRLSGFIKTDSIEEAGTAGLFLRIDGANGPLAQDNMKLKKINGTRDWKKYSIDLTLPEQAKKVVFGGWLEARAGSVWFDELHLYIEGKELAKTLVYKARLDTAFANGSGVKFPALTKDNVRNLQLLGQVWGFLKYHHPSVAAGQYNWDAELFRMLPSYLNTKSNKARDKALIDWIDKLGTLPACASCNSVLDSTAKVKPDHTWIQGKEVSPELRDKLNYVYSHRTQDKNYYVSIGAGIGNAEFINEDPYSQFTYPDEGYRLLSLYRYWNSIHYYFPYKYAMDNDWSTVLMEFIPHFLKAKDKLEYRRQVVELIERIHDTHANLWGRDSVWSNYKGKYQAAVQTKFIEGKLVVTNFHTKKRSESSQLQIGDIITDINGRKVDDILKDRLIIYPASNYSTKLRDIAKDMLRGRERQVLVNVQRNNQSLSFTVNRYPLDSIDTSLDRSYSLPDSCYSFLTKDIGYINLGNIKADLLPRIFKAFSNTKGIVIDIRNYPSEFVVFSLGNYLLAKAEPFVKFTTASVANPGLFTWGTTLKVGHQNNDHYKGKVTILINEITQSQAEYTTMALRTARHATVIGSTTAGADGNVSIFYLPGNLRTMISGIGVYYPDGRETQRIGIVPDLEVKPTIEGIRQKRDEALEKAIQVIESD
jgi:C-terminal processing protease CtpA/Prc